MPAKVLAALVVAGWALLTSPAVQATGCDDVFSQHMVAEALLAANFVAAAERTGMQPRDINVVLKEIADRSAIDEFWITDSSGRAYLTNTNIDFTFSPDPAKQPQASAFWPLIEGKEKTVVQAPRKREIDDQVYKYVGVAGVDKPRIVQIGVSAKNLPACN